MSSNIFSTLFFFALLGCDDSLTDLHRVLGFVDETGFSFTLHTSTNTRADWKGWMAVGAARFFQPFDICRPGKTTGRAVGNLRGSL